MPEKISFIFFLFLSVAFLPSAVFAEDAERLYNAKPGLPLCVEPGGSRLADLTIGTPVHVLEKKGEWAKVSLEGWVRLSMLKPYPIVQDGIQVAAQKGEGLISIAKYTLKMSGEDKKNQLVVLNLTLKNNSEEVLTAWQGILVAIKDNKILFREALSQHGLKIAPGATGEASFEWKEGEKSYNAIAAAVGGSFDLQLLKAKVN